MIRGAREHNLKNVSLDLPRNKMIVFTGVSGSGKSSLAFDTIFAEARRRYVESLSASPGNSWARWTSRTLTRSRGFRRHLHRPKAHSANPRSTVATITEIYDYLRALCPRGASALSDRRQPIKRLTIDEMVDVMLQKTKDPRCGGYGSGAGPEKEGGRPRRSGVHQRDRHPVPGRARPEVGNISSCSRTCRKQAFSRTYRRIMGFVASASSFTRYQQHTIGWWWIACRFAWPVAGNDAPVRASPKPRRPPSTAARAPWLHPRRRLRAPDVVQVLLFGVRLRVPGSRAAPVFLQFTPRRLSHLQWFGHEVPFSRRSARPARAPSSDSRRCVRLYRRQNIVDLTSMTITAAGPSP